MANYVSNTIFISGTKQSVVDFLNIGLKNDKVQERVSAQMSGEETVALINGVKRPLSMGSFIPRPKTFDTYDTTNEIKSFYYWFLDGCTANQDGRDSDLREKRQQEVIDYLKAHPEDFQPDENGKYSRIAEGTAIERLHPGINAAYVKYTKGYYQARYYQKKKYGVVGWYDWNKANYGCKWNMPFEQFKCMKDTDNALCLRLYLQTPWSPAHKFIENINTFEGISVYAEASGDMNEPFFFWYNGRTDEGDIVVPEDLENYEQRRKTIKDEYQQRLEDEPDVEKRDKIEFEERDALMDLAWEILNVRSKWFDNVLVEELGINLNDK